VTSLQAVPYEVIGYDSGSFHSRTRWRAGFAWRFMAETKRFDESPWRAGWESARLLIWPGLILQSAALALVLAYYFVPAAHGFFAQIARWREAGGYLFSTVATSFCGGVLPFLYLRWNPATRSAHPWSQLAFFTLFWAWKGVEVDLMYRGLSRVFGQEATFLPIAAKVLVDQLVYNPFYATPVSSLLYAWKNAGFRLAPVVADWRAGRWYQRRVIAPQLAVWWVWGPAVCCIYALPPVLQIPLFNVVLCFWSLLFASITTRQHT